MVNSTQYHLPSDPFCGRQPFLPSSSTLISECFINFLSTLPNALFLLVLLPNVFLRWFKSRSPCDATSRKAGAIYHCHTLRWVTSLVAIVLHVFALTEGLLSSVTFSNWSLHLYFPYILAIIVSGLTLVVYTFAEEYRIAGLMAALLLYWGSECLLALVKVGFDFLFIFQLN